MPRKTKAELEQEQNKELTGSTGTEGEETPEADGTKQTEDIAEFAGEGMKSSEQDEPGEQGESGEQDEPGEQGESGEQDEPGEQRESGEQDESGEQGEFIPEETGFSMGYDPALDPSLALPPAPQRSEPEVAVKPEVTTQAPANESASGGEAEKSTPATPPRRGRAATAASQVLSIDDDVKVQSAEDKEAYLWMELRNSLRSKRILTGILGGVERKENDACLAVIYYKDRRVAIPASEMFINIGEHESGDERDLQNRYAQILNRSLGAEMDFIVTGLNRRGNSVVASRREAMERKQQYFYISPRRKTPLVHEGQIVEARVISVGEKNVRVEVFGVETTIVAREVAWEWVDDCGDYYETGDRVLLKIMRINLDNRKDIQIYASIRETTPNPAYEEIKNCSVGGKYIGKVTGVDPRAIFVRLNVGVNGLATAVHDRKNPSRKDDVSFVVTRIDKEQGVAIGIITRIIKQYV